MYPRYLFKDPISRFLFAATLERCVLGTWGLVVAGVGLAASSVIQADGSRKAMHAQQDALKAQQGLVANLKYEPIDLDKLRAEAAEQAIANATNSLAIERQTQPEVAAVRSGLAKSVNSELAQGGKVSADIANQVSQAGRTAGMASGIGGNSAPVTAALLGQTATGLLQQRQANAASLLAGNPLPEGGLDPGSLASAEIAQNAAQNQFNLEKAGASSNLIQSAGNIQAAKAGSDAALYSSLASGLTSLAGGYLNRAPVKSGVTTVPTGLDRNAGGSFNSTVPTSSASGLWG